MTSDCASPEGRVELPKLTKPQMARLIEVGKRKWPSYGASPATMKKLEELGCIRPQGGKIAKTGRVIWHADGVLTDIGLRILAGFPGDEFAQFRAILTGDPDASR